MKNITSLKFHHLGLASDNLNLSLKNLKSLGYKVKSIKINKAYNVKNAICVSNKMPNVEVISKIKGKKSPIDNIIKNNRNLIYHICYISDNLYKTLAILKKKKISFTRISKPEKSPFEKLYSSFFYINGLGIVEIMDKSNRK